VPISANPREGADPINIDVLIENVIGSIEALPTKDPAESLYYAVDHCFPLKGKGTVLTGTILTGEIKVGQNVEIANMRIQKKIKSMQSFHRNVSHAVKGDRVAICVT